MDYEDALDGAPVHPNAAIVPVAMALAEHQGDISGADFITAMAIGCDLGCRMGLALEVNPDQFGWYPPPLLSAFAAAATASRLLKLDTAQTANALALALAQAGFPAEFKSDATSSLRGVRDAYPAQAGLSAAMLAQRGVRGHATALEGKHGFFSLFARGHWSEERLFDNLGQRFLGADVAFKPWPSCRGTHAFIEAALHLRPQIGDPLREIERIDSTGPALMTMLVEPLERKRAPQTAIDAKFSLPFTIAAALVEGHVSIPTFLESGRTHPAVLEIANRVHFTADPALGMKDAASGALTIRLKGGRVLQHHVREARGAPSNPLDDDALAGKFRDCARYAAISLTPANVERLISGLSSMRSATNAAERFEALR
jgi:2-methylcitrate dehydratase PrpD